MYRTETHKMIVYHGTDKANWPIYKPTQTNLKIWYSPDHAVLKTDLLKATFDASVFTMDPTPLREGPF